MRYQFSPNAKKLQIIFFTLCYIVIILAGFYLPQTGDVIQQIYVMGWIGWGLLLWSAWSWKYLFEELFCPNLIFLFVAYLFTFSQSLLLPLGLVPEKLNLLYKFSSSVLLEAQLFTLICLAFYHIGCVLGGSKNIADQEHDNRLFESIKKVGMYLLIISFVPFVINIFQMMSEVFRSGYGGLYNKSDVAVGLSAVIMNIAEYFQPALICLLVATTFNKTKQKLIYVLFVAIILINLYLGARSEAVIFLVLLLLYNHYYVAPLKGFRLFVFMFAGFLFLSFLSVVGEVRSEVGRSFADYGYAFIEKITTDNLVIKAVCEMGGSMFPLASTIELVPNSYPFRGGSTYFYAFTSVIPNLNFWDVHPAMLYANLGDWLQNVLQLTYGPGYSLVAEAYINWGWFGFIFFILYGWVNGRIFTLVAKKNVLIRPDLFCFVMIILILTIKTNRNSFLATVRGFFYMGIPIYLMVRYVYYRKLKEHLVSKPQFDGKKVVC